MPAAGLAPTTAHAMSEAAGTAAGRAGPSVAPLVVGGAILAGSIAVAIGAALGEPTRLNLLLTGAIVALIPALLVGIRPFAGYLIMVGSSIMLIVATAIQGRAANALDAMLLPVAAGSYWGPARRLALERDARESGPEHDAIRLARRRLSGATIAFYAAAVLSLLPMALRSGMGSVLDPVLHLLRAFQGLALFPLGLILVRSVRHIRYVIRALLVGGAALAVINANSVGSGSVVRAGMTWFANEPLWSIGDPNEASTAMLMLIVLLLVRQAVRAQTRNFVMLGIAVAMLVLTQARSGLLAFLTFALLTIRPRQWRILAWCVPVVLIALPLIPEPYWQRMSKTVVMERGSFEAYTALIRVYGWKAAWRLFLDHPVMGAGFLGFRQYSAHYNPLGVIIGTAESFYLEIACGMGLIGLALFGLVIVRMYQLGHVIRRLVSPGTLAHWLASFHPAYITALLVANLTGDNFLGMVGLAQIAIWHAVLIRAGHEALPKLAPAEA